MKKFSALVAIPVLALSLSACGGDSKPSKDDVIKGFTKVVQSSGLGSQVDSKLVDTTVKCIVDKAYDKLSTDGLKALAEGKASASASSSDVTAISTATKACQQEILDQAKKSDK